jgi:hypothetical protein
MQHDSIMPLKKVPVAANAVSEADRSARQNHG